MLLHNFQKFLYRYILVDMEVVCWPCVSRESCILMLYVVYFIGIAVFNGLISQIPGAAIPYRPTRVLYHVPVREHGATDPSPAMIPAITPKTWIRTLLLPIIFT